MKTATETSVLTKLGLAATVIAIIYCYNTTPISIGWQETTENTTTIKTTEAAFEEINGEDDVLERLKKIIERLRTLTVDQLKEKLLNAREEDIELINAIYTVLLEKGADIGGGRYHFYFIKDGKGFYILVVQDNQGELWRETFNLMEEIGYDDAYIASVVVELDDDGYDPVYQIIDEVTHISASEPYRRDPEGLHPDPESYQTWVEDLLEKMGYDPKPE